ncbi:MAG: polyprenyl synthetase family protein [Candidatus Woesebacteria bacterium]
MDLSTALVSHSHEMDQTIADFLDLQEKEAKKIDRYIDQSMLLLKTFSLRGGKSIRSFLCRIAYDLAKGKKNPGLAKALASIELHHKHILILDDISDRDESRYGGPTLEYAYREVMSGLPDEKYKAMSFAMLDGVLLGSLAKELLISSGFSAKILIECIHLFDTIMYRDVLAGWQIHGMQCTQTLSKATQEEFIKGLRLVTASYTFEGPLLMGLTLAESKDTKLETALRLYAANVGTAFQMHDDILGLFGDSKKTGKPVGNDVREGKKTLLLQVAFERGSTQEREMLEQACGKAISADTLKAVQKIVQDTGSLEYSKQLEKEYVEKGIQALQDLPKSPQKQMLIELAAYIISREK